MSTRVPAHRPWHVASLGGSSRLAFLAVACGLLAACAPAGRGSATPASSSSVRVLARSLSNPRQLSIAADGSLYVAVAGSGGRRRCVRAPDSGALVCIGDSGSIVRIRRGIVRTVLAGLPSVAGVSGTFASGVADVLARSNRLVFVIQDTHIDAAGSNEFGAHGVMLGRLIVAGGADRLVSLADLARYEGRHDPDHGAGAPPAQRISSDPYALAAFRGGYAVADAGANDLLWVDAAGRIHLLAVFSVRYGSQAVPTSVAVGPDGALYVGELTGYPYHHGAARIWRVEPGSKPSVYADGFTNISALTFDRHGRLLVLEINREGLLHPTASGELIRIARDGTRHVLATTGLHEPTGVAVAANGTIYIANNGASTAAGGGEIIVLRDR